MIHDPRSCCESPRHALANHVYAVRRDLSRGFCPLGQGPDLREFCRLNCRLPAFCVKMLQRASLLKVSRNNWYNWHTQNQLGGCVMSRNHVVLWIAVMPLLLNGVRPMAAADDPVTAGATAKPAASEPIPVHIHGAAAEPKGELKPVWRFLGADEPNYAYMKDGQKLIGELGEMRPNEVYFRAHNLLTTGDGTPALKWGSTNAYREDADGK